MPFKTLLKFTFLFAFIILFAACTNEEPPCLGCASDTIQFSKTTATVSAAGETLTITSQSKTWWFKGLKFNNEFIDSIHVTPTDQDFVIKNKAFRVEHKNGNTLKITMYPNQTQQQRVLLLKAQAGDYFDQITIVQKKE